MVQFSLNIYHSHRNEIDREMLYMADHIYVGAGKKCMYNLYMILGLSGIQFPLTKLNEYIRKTQMYVIDMIVTII